MNELVQEWLALQKQSDDFDKYSLLIKLFNVVVVILAFGYSLHSMLTLAIIVIVWMQDAIWKTFQSRTEQRIILLEKDIAEVKSGQEGQSILPFQLNQQFAENRPSTVGLIKEYLKQSLRPTVAYPHILLLILSGYFLLF